MIYVSEISREVGLFEVEHNDNEKSFWNQAELAHMCTWNLHDLEKLT